MPTKEFPLIGFQPDVAADTPGVLCDTNQVIPTDRGFASAQNAVLVGSAFGSQPCGGIEVTKIDGTSRPFIGTDTALYELVANVATNRSAYAYSASQTQQWSFAQMGDDTLAVNKGNKLQVSSAGAFADASTDAPKASIVTVCGPPNRSFAMLVDYDDGTNNYKDGLFWSPNIASWSTANAIEDQIGNIRLTDINGALTAAVGFRDEVVVFKNQAMYGGEYVGGGDMWAFTRLSSTVGCVGPNAVCAAGDVLYFADNFGLWEYDGSYPRPMPGAVHDWFSQQSYGKDVRLTWDARRHLVWVRYTDDGTGIGLFAAFNVRSQKWAKFGTIGAAAHLIGPNYSAAFLAPKAQFQSYGISNPVNTIPARIRFNAFGTVYGNMTVRSLRPQFLVGGPDTSSGWASGVMYHGPSLRGTAISVDGDAVAFSGPNRLDVMRQDRYVQPEITVTEQFEIDRIAVDMRYDEGGE